MYAVIRDSGRQYFVEEGQTVKVDRRDLEEGAPVEFDEVLVIGGEGAELKVGQPTIAGAKVVAESLGEMREKKIHVQTYKRRKNLIKHKGHRQTKLEVKITQIVTG